MSVPVEADASAGRPPREPPGPGRVAGDSAGAPRAARPPELYADVWSRTEPKYRVRAVVLLALNLVLFCGLCAFTHWLHVGQALEFSAESYLRPLRLSGSDTQTLYDFVLFPINVARIPIHAVVLGLLLASIVAVPIVIAILYRFVFALPFVAAVLLLAHLPWMALTLLGSCVLASVPPFRMRFRYGSALVGMLPVLVYLYLATRAAPGQVGQYASPMQQSLLIAPWVLAVLLACGMMAVVLLVWRTLNHRPGAVAPVLAFMFLTPVVLFHVSVGADELHFRVLETRYGPHSPGFEPTEDTTEDIRTMMALADRPAYYEHLMAVWKGEVEPTKRAIIWRMTVRLLEVRAAAYDACKFFLADHPNSRYVPDVLYMQARALDTRLDERRLVASPPKRELYVDFPHPQSEKPWTALFSDHPDTPFSIAAGLRLAQLRLRRGEVNEAERILWTVLDRSARVAATQPGRADRLTLGREAGGVEFEPQPYLREARRLYELIGANRDDPHFGNEPLTRLAALDPHRVRYADELLRLAQAFRGGRLHDNVMLAWISTCADEGERAARLLALAEAFPDGDACAEALLHAAEHELRSGDAEVRQRGVARLRDVAERFAESAAGAQAAERLRIAELLRGRRPASP